jgi:hypothetical protein
MGMALGTGEAVPKPYSCDPGSVTSTSPHCPESYVDVFPLPFLTTGCEPGAFAHVLPGPVYPQTTPALPLPDSMCPPPLKAVFFSLPLSHPYSVQLMRSVGWSWRVG